MKMAWGAQTLLSTPSVAFRRQRERFLERPLEHEPPIGSTGPQRRRVSQPLSSIFNSLLGPLSIAFPQFIRLRVQSCFVEESVVDRLSERMGVVVVATPRAFFAFARG